MWAAEYQYVKHFDNKKMKRNHTPFLQQVASYYGGKSGLAD